MRRIIAFESVTLDGVMQAPGRPDEDTRGGFIHGGWAVAYADETITGMATENMSTTDAILLGRRTYEDFFGFWPKQPDNPFTDILNATQKYVVSRTLSEPLAWQNATLLADEDAVAHTKQGPGKDILLGSGELARSLARRNLIDEYVLLVHPLVIGTGRRLFDGDLPRTVLDLVGTRTSTSGVIIATYRISGTQVETEDR
jgi:dihydrofolate reductase